MLIVYLLNKIWLAFFKPFWNFRKDTRNSTCYFSCSRVAMTDYVLNFNSFFKQKYKQHVSSFHHILVLCTKLFVFSGKLLFSSFLWQVSVIFSHLTVDFLSIWFFLFKLWQFLKQVEINMQWVAHCSIFCKKFWNLFPAFVCLGLNAGRLSRWIRLVYRTTSLVSTHYTDSSYVARTGMDGVATVLSKLDSVTFRLPVDVAVRPFKNIRDAF